MQLKTIKEMIYLVNFVRAPPWVISILTESVPLWRGGHYSHYRPSPLFTPQNLAVIQILSKVCHAGPICQLFTENLLLLDGITIFCSLSTEKESTYGSGLCVKDKYLEEQNAEENWLRRKTGLVR